MRRNRKNDKTFFYEHFVVNKSILLKKLIKHKTLFLPSMQSYRKTFLKTLITSLFLFVAILALAQHRRMTTREYIKKYKKVAIMKMKQYKIPASVTLAQGILESGSGNSRLARKANNHFGIKCHKDWKGKRFYMNDDVRHECFRKYRKPEDSYRDHSLFLTKRGRYSFLFDYRITDYRKWAYGLKKAGYATNPKYPKLLIKIIKKYHLDQYDNQALKGKRKYRSRRKIVAPPSIAGFIKYGKSPNGLYQIYKNNGKKLIIATKGDTFKKIADEFEMYIWQLYKYNDTNKKHVLKIGEIVYLQKKKRKPQRKYKVHIVRQGETLRFISQLYGMRLSRIYKLNNLPAGIQVANGTQLIIR